MLTSSLAVQQALFSYVWELVKVDADYYLFLVIDNEHNTRDSFLQDGLSSQHDLHPIFSERVLFNVLFSQRHIWQTHSVCLEMNEMSIPHCYYFVPVIR